MNTDKVYILQKDLPDGASVGDRYIKKGDKYWNERFTKDDCPVVEDAQWFTWQVENNPEWFKPEENKSNDSFQWDDTLALEFLNAHRTSDQIISKFYWKKESVEAFKNFKQSHTPKPQAENKPDLEKAKNILRETSKPDWDKLEKETFQERCFVKPQPQKEEQEEMLRFKAVPKPQEQRIEVEDGIEFLTDGFGGRGVYWFQTVRQIHPDKFPALKQAIESVLNNESPAFDWMFRYTQSQVDSMCEDAFQKGRDFISVDWVYDDWKDVLRDREIGNKNSKQKQ